MTDGCLYCRQGERLPLTVHPGDVEIIGGCLRITLTAFERENADDKPTDTLAVKEIHDITKQQISYCPMCGREL